MSVSPRRGKEILNESVLEEYFVHVLTNKECLQLKKTMVNYVALFQVRRASPAERSVFPRCPVVEWGIDSDN